MTALLTAKLSGIVDFAVVVSFHPIGLWYTILTTVKVKIVSNGHFYALIICSYCGEGWHSYGRSSPRLVVASMKVAPNCA